jgi:hypothetical protein
VSTVTRSTFGPPVAVTAVARIVLVPAVTFTLIEAVCQAVHAPVPAKGTSSPASVPLTVMSIARLAVVPLANRKVSVAAPASDAVTDHWT